MSYVQASGGLQNLVDGTYTGAVRGIGALNENSYRTGSYAFAEGHGTWARGTSSHAEGEQTRAYEAYSHAEGYQTSADGTYAHAEGYHTTAAGNYSHAEGYGSSSDQYVPIMVYPKVFKGYISTAANPDVIDTSDPAHYIYTLHMTEGKITDVFVGNRFQVIDANTVGDLTNNPNFYIFVITYINYDTGEIWIGENEPGYERAYYPPIIDNATVCITVNRIEDLAYDAYMNSGDISDITNNVIYDGTGNVKISKETNIDGSTTGFDESLATVITLSSSNLDIQVGDFFINLNSQNSGQVIYKISATQYVLNHQVSDELGNSVDLYDFGIVRGVCYKYWEYGSGAYGNGSHSGGCYTRVEGNYATTIGKYTYSLSRSQLVIGEYNVLDIDSTRYDYGSFTGSEDIRSRYAFIIGNGTDNQNRSNAFAVDWHGNIDIPRGTGLYSVDSDEKRVGLIADNGNNLWIGAGSSDFPHHSGTSGYTYISSGYNTTNST